MPITVNANIMIVNAKLLLIVKKWITPYCNRVSYSIPYNSVSTGYYG